MQGHWSRRALLGRRGRRIVWIALFRSIHSQFHIIPPKWKSFKLINNRSSPWPRRGARAGHGARRPFQHFLLQQFV